MSDCRTVTPLSTVATPRHCLSSPVSFLSISHGKHSRLKIDPPSCTHRCNTNPAPLMAVLADSSELWCRWAMMLPPSIQGVSCRGSWQRPPCRSSGHQRCCQTGRNPGPLSALQVCPCPASLHEQASSSDAETAIDIHPDIEEA